MKWRTGQLLGVSKKKDELFPIKKEEGKFHMNFGFLNLPCGLCKIWKHKDRKKRFQLKKITVPIS